MRLYSVTCVPLSHFLLNLLIQNEFSCGVVNWMCGAFWLLQLKENYFLNDQIQTLHIKKPTKQGFAYCLIFEYRKLWFWCIMDIFSKKYQQSLNVQNFWEKKIISKFPVDIHQRQFNISQFSILQFKLLRAVPVFSLSKFMDQRQALFSALDQHEVRLRALKPTSSPQPAN